MVSQVCSQLRTIVTVWPSVVLIGDHINAGEQIVTELVDIAWLRQSSAQTTDHYIIGWHIDTDFELNWVRKNFVQEIWKVIFFSNKRSAYIPCSITLASPWFLIMWKFSCRHSLGMYTLWNQSMNNSFTGLLFINSIDETDVSYLSNLSYFHWINTKVCTEYFVILYNEMKFRIIIEIYFKKL